MIAKVLIPTPLKQYTEYQEEVVMEGTTVGEVLINLIHCHPGLKNHLYSEEGKLRNFVNVYLNDEDVRYLSQGDTALKENDTISIIPAIAGGTGVLPFRP